MKRCNYFSSLAVVFLMFFGMTLSAQSYKTSKDAAVEVQKVINQNIPKQASLNGQSTGVTSLTAQSYYSNLDRPTKVRNLKVDYGKRLLELLNANISVKDALLKVSSISYDVYKLRGELDILQEVESFYSNLLSK